MKNIIVGAFFLLVIIGFNWSNEIIIEPSVDGVGSERFGWDVDLDDDIAISSWRSPNAGKNGYGAVFVYQRDQGGESNWGFVKKIINTQADSTDNFGVSVSLSDDNILVGTGKETSWLYNRHAGGENNWGLLKTLVSSTSQTNFGSVVDLSDEFAIIGASNTPNGSDTLSGAVYIYERNEGGENNWGEVKLLAISDTNYTGYNFGVAVAIDNNHAIVTARTSSGIAPGVAFVFEKDDGGTNNWGLIATLSGDTERLDQFGFSVDLEDGVAVIGANIESTFATFSGSLYIFEKDAGGSNNWGKTKVLSSSNVEEKQSLGFDVSISGDYILAGANRKSYNGSRYYGGGAFYYYRHEGGTNNWGEVLSFSPSDGAPLYFFGSSVALDGDLAFIGSYGKKVGQVWNAGGAYLFGSLDTVNKEQAPKPPTKFTLNQNYPNPFNPTTTFSINLEFGSDVNVSIYNLAGQKVRTLSSGILPAGEHFFTWDSHNDAGAKMPSGVYFYRLKTGLFTETRQMILIK